VDEVWPEKKPGSHRTAEGLAYHRAKHPGKPLLDEVRALGTWHTLGSLLARQNASETLVISALTHYVAARSCRVQLCVTYRVQAFIALQILNR
jgi:hypothetical protein